jgi:hypothetical protein
MHRGRKPLVLTGGVGWALVANPGALAHPSGANTCEAIRSGLGRLEMAARSTLDDVQAQRREPERLAEWFGSGMFEPYTDALRV